MPARNRATRSTSAVRSEEPPPASRHSRVKTLPAGEELAGCRQRYLRPEPRVRLGTALGRNRAAHACIDLSDGLADAVHQLAAASRVGARLEADTIPVDLDARAWFERRVSIRCWQH